MQIFKLCIYYVIFYISDYISLNLPFVDIVSVDISNSIKKCGMIYSVSGDVTNPAIFEEGKNDLAIIFYCINAHG